MKKFNEMVVIGIDHGYGNMKTANCCFPTGVMKSDTEPTFVSDLLQWNGKYYSIGVGHKEFTADKFNDEDYYVLTLAAIARELRRERITEASVFIAAGLPLTWVSEQKAEFKKYLLQHSEVEFTFRNTEYRIKIVGAEIYPQGFAAVAERLGDFKGVNMLCDIGNGTMNLLRIVNKKATARKMWGDRYQVLVTVHLNTENVHCHFVVNPVSFKDGTKFQNKIGDHKELRRVSDEICREHGLSVLENSSFYGGHKKDYWRHKAGKKTHRDYLREDVEYCLTFATSPREFESQLYALGYTLDPVRFSVKAKHWERSVRLANIGFTKEIVQTQLDKNAESRYRLFTLEYRPPYRPKKFPLEEELRKLDFAIDHSYDAATVLVDTIFYIIITVIQIAAELADVILLSPDLKAAEKDLKDLVADYNFLKENDIHSVADLQANIDENKVQLSDLEHERNTLSNRIRRPKSPEDENQNKETRKAISKQMKPIRERLRHAEKILEKSPHLYELLKQEHELEKKARARYLDRSR